MSHQRFSGYCTDIRCTAYSTQALIPAFRSLKWQVALRLDYDSSLKVRWVQCLKDYEEIVHDSRDAAHTLSVVVDLYTSLLSRLQKTANADVGHELATLKESITGIAKYDYGPRLDALQNAVECFLSSLSSSARRTAQKGSSFGWVGFASSTIQAVAYHLLWTPLLYVGGILPPIADDDVNHARDQNRGRDDEGLVFIKNPKSAQEVITNVRFILSSLKAQMPLFGVLRQIASELLAEIDLHSAALKAVKDSPKSPANVEVARRIHEAAASRVEEWKGLARVLSHEYARE